MKFPRRSHAWVAVGFAGIALDAFGPGVAGGTVAPPGTAGKRTVFHGRIASGTKIYARSHGVVRLILTSGGGPTPDPLLGDPSYPLTVAVSGPKCRRPPDGCVTLTGTLTGTATVNPDSSYLLGPPLKGRISPLGKISLAGGVISSSGTPTRHRLVLILVIEGKAGLMKIEARSPIMPGFPSPF